MQRLPQADLGARRDNLRWAALVAIVGVMLLTRPLAGAQAITLVLAFYFFVSGLATIGFAFRHILMHCGLFLPKAR